MANNPKPADNRTQKKDTIEVLATKVQETASSYSTLNVVAGVFVLAVFLAGFSVFGLSRAVFLAFLTALILNSFVMVPAFHYGVHERLGRRTGRIYQEGLGIKLPLIDRVRIVSEELATVSFSASFTTKDRMQLRVLGPLQYRPDSNVTNREGRNVFIEVSDEVIAKGISEAVESKLGALGGIKNAEEFVKNRQAIGDMLNCFFRLSMPPHLNHNSAACGVSGCSMPAMVSAEDLIPFYNTHWQLVRDVLNREDQMTDDFSSLEKRYGLDVVFLAVPVVDFTEETKQAFEEEKQAEARKRAFAKKIEIVREVIELGADPHVALDAADVSLEPEIAKNKRIFSVEGLSKGLINLFLGERRSGGS